MKLASLCFNLHFLIVILAVLGFIFQKDIMLCMINLLLIWNWFKILDSSVHSKKCGCVHIDGDTTLAIISKLWHRFLLTLRIFIEIY